MPRPPELRRRWAVVLGAASGLVTEAAFPDRGWWGAAFLGMAMLFLAMRRDSASWNALVGFVWGLAFFLPHIIWAEYAVGLVPWIALSVLEAGLVGLFGAAWTWARRGVGTWRSPGLQVVVFTLLWVAMEELRSSWPFGGFPWGRLAFSQAESPLGPLAWLAGSPLVSAAVAGTGALLAVAVLCARRLRVIRALAATATAVLVVLAGLLVPLDTRSQDGTLRVGAVQGNVPTPGLDAFAQQREVLHNHAAGTEALLGQVDPGYLDLVVWPENGSDIDPQVDVPAAEEIDDVAQAVEAPVLVGTIEYPETGGRYNTAVLWEPGVGVTAHYSKQHPAPFAEYIPLRELVRPFSSAVDLVRNDMIAGTEVGIVPVEAARLGRTVPTGVVICFEVAYDSLVRDAVRAGAELLVVQTNNASFGYTDESTQQLAMSTIRAMELGRSTVHISTVGVSAVISPDGAVSHRTGLFTAEQIVAEVPLRTTLTPAAALGDWPTLVIAVLGIVVTLAGMVGARRVRRPGREDRLT